MKAETRYVHVIQVDGKLDFPFLNPQTFIQFLKFLKNKFVRCKNGKSLTKSVCPQPEDLRFMQIQTIRHTLSLVSLIYSNGIWHYEYFRNFGP